MMTSSDSCFALCSLQELHAKGIINLRGEKDRNLDFKNDLVVKKYTV